ncbi:MAG: helix-turn-helix transcriptional regulator [Verrucomicrobia bacterium]|nr:helix-turn-helix transcriptional regulator [Verrucomicrobiota bacterium]
MSEAEAAIGARVKEFRERIEWPQSVFANEIGVTRNKLASIEYGRTPLRCALALRICKRYHISELWLAKGVGSSQPDLGLEKGIEASIPPKMLFSRAFADMLESRIDAGLLEFLKYNERTGATEVILPPFGVPPAHRHEWFVLKAFKGASESLPANERAEFCDAVLRSISTLLKARRPEAEDRHVLQGSLDRFNRQQREAALGKGAGQKTFSLDKDILDTPQGGGVTVAGMRLEVPTWKQLKKSIAHLTSEHGAKAALAKELGVSRQVLNNWLSDAGQGAPPADLTLRLFRWSLEQGTPKPK